MSQTGHFDAVAARYDRLRGPTELTPVHELLAREGGLAGKRVLDVGCGTGIHAAILRDRFDCEVACIDASTRMLDQARLKLPDADVRHGVAEALPWPAASFDAGLMLLVVHHLDRPRAFAEAARVLVPGGRLLVLTSNPDAFPRFWMAPLFPSYVRVEQARFPGYADLERELLEAGFGRVRRIDHTVPRAFSRDEALARLRGRHASTFDLLDPREYEEGLARAECELPDPVRYDLELMLVVATT